MPENSFGDLNPEAMSDDMFSAIFGSDEPSETEAEQEKPAKRIMAPASDKTSVLRNVPTVIVRLPGWNFRTPRIIRMPLWHICVVFVPESWRTILCVRC